MQKLLARMLKGWLADQLKIHVVDYLRRKAKSSNSKWDDVLVNELEHKINDWVNRI